MSERIEKLSKRPNQTRFRNAGLFTLKKEYQKTLKLCYSIPKNSWLLRRNKPKNWSNNSFPLGKVTQGFSIRCSNLLINIPFLPWVSSLHGSSWGYLLKTNIAFQQHYHHHHHHLHKSSLSLLLLCEVEAENKHLRSKFSKNRTATH